MDQIKEHFSITELPFELTPNVDYFCQFKGHENALQILKICIEKGESLVKITGEVGTGKTLICRKLIQDIDAMGHITLYIYNPAFGAETLQRLVADELGIQYPDNATEHWLAKKTTEKLAVNFP